MNRLFEVVLIMKDFRILVSLLLFLFPLIVNIQLNPLVTMVIHLHEKIKQLHTAVIYLPTTQCMYNLYKTT